MGSLYSWNSKLDRAHGGWQLIKTGVTCNATANGGTKSTPCQFRHRHCLHATSGQRALPNTSPIALSSGGILIT